MGCACTTVMPLFRRQSEKGRKKQQRQEFLAQQDPEPKFDLSGCELLEVPSGVYAICRVLQKEALFLHGNWLSNLNGGGTISDLSNLRVLDLHSNELKHLPDDIGSLERLQVLNLESNKLKRLPSSIGNLRSLQTLNLRGNVLKELPESICDLPALRLLDLVNNELHVVPRKLAYVRSLETLLVDVEKFKYPGSDICKKGTEAMMRFLCSENGLEYEPPSKFFLEVVEPPIGISLSRSENSIKTYQDEARLMDCVDQYQNQLAKKRAEAQALEEQLAIEHQVQQQLAAAAASNKKNLIDAIAQDQARMDLQLSELSTLKDAERKKFLDTLNAVEKSAGDLVAELMDMNEKAKKTEALLDEIEQERMIEDDWFSVRWEELMNLRRKEVLEGMNHILNEYRVFEEQRQLSENERDYRNKQALEMEEMTSHGQVESMLYHKQVEQRAILDTLAQQEELQRKAVEALQLAQDARHTRITGQIALIESELAQLTLVEMDKSALRMEAEMNVLAEKRIALTGMLAQLLDEQHQREAELKERLREMEQQREDGQTDYWLVQYQRLLDKKPQVLIDKESQLEIAVKKVLIHAGAEDYIPVFARHRITIETLVQLDDRDLQQMGVHEVGLRKAIMSGIEQQRAEATKLTQKEKDIFLLPQVPVAEPTPPEAAEPSAPPPEPPSAIAGGSGPKRQISQISVTARGINSECVVCLDRTSEVIFLPCGHVCSCPICARPLTDCPMCRAPITQRIKLTVPVQS